MVLVAILLSRWFMAAVLRRGCLWAKGFVCQQDMLSEKKSLSKGFFFGKLDFDFHTLCNFLQVWSLVEIVEGI